MIRDMFMRLIISVLFIFISSFGFGQNIGGYFNYEKVKKSVPEYETNKDLIKELETKYNDSLLVIISPFQKKISDAPNIEYSPEELEKIQDSIQKLEQKIESFRKSALEAVELKRKKLDQSINKIILSSINDFCESKNIKYLTKKNDLLFCVECLDYTNELIEFMKLKK